MVQDEIEESRIEEWDEDNKIKNLQDPYNELQEKFSGQEFLIEGYCYELPQL